MKIWKQDFTLEGLNELGNNTLGSHLDMEFIEFGDDYLVLRMPVKEKHKQPLGLLHGGATAALAETIGSVASVLCLESLEYSAVGIELNINHLSSISEGFAIAMAKPIKIGRTLHVWDIRIHNEDGKPVSVSRLTTLIKKVNQN